MDLAAPDGFFQRPVFSARARKTAPGAGALPVSKSVFWLIRKSMKIRLAIVLKMAFTVPNHSLDSRVAFQGFEGF
jgi:hypothetical protein